MDATASGRVLGGRGSWWPRTGLLAALVLAGILVQGCTDNNGRVTGTDAKVTGDAIGGAIKVSVTINPGAIDRGRRASVVVIVSSPNGFPLVGRRVDLSSVGGRLDATTGITDANGRFTTTVFIPCETLPGSVTVTAFADNQSQVAATATANVGTSAANDPCAGVIPAPPAAPGAPTLPTVTITSAGTANETGPVTATFTVSRTGSTTAPLSVFLATSGSATFGADYGLTGSIVGTTVTIPAGSASTVITLNPVTDAPNPEADDPSGPDPDAELAILTITPAATYTVGSPGAAQVEIIDGG